MIYGILAALDEELKPLLDQADITDEKQIYGSTVYTGTLRGKEVALAKCGIATINAALYASILIREFGAGALINTGIAGALGHGVRMLDVVISSDAAYHDRDSAIMDKYYPFTSVFKADERLISLARNAAEGLRPDGRAIAVHVGRVATGDAFICERAKKDDIVARLQPLCVEMEGAAIANAAYLESCPFVIVRTMSDCADEEAGEHYDRLIETAGELSAAIVLRMLENA